MRTRPLTISGRRTNTLRQTETDFCRRAFPAEQSSGGFFIMASAAPFLLIPRARGLRGRATAATVPRRVQSQEGLLLRRLVPERRDREPQSTQVSGTPNG